MSLKQSESREQFRYEAPILPDNVDSATAMFYALNLLIRSTPFEMREMEGLQEPVFPDRRRLDFRIPPHRGCGGRMVTLPGCSRHRHSEQMKPGRACRSFVQLVG
jgi:hypothetical protein